MFKRSGARADASAKQLSPCMLSVAVVAGEQRHRIERCIAGLLAQTALPSIEILILDLAPSLGPLRGTDHPSVRYLPREDLDTFWSAQAALAREARGDAVAYIEEHCFAEPEWAEALIDAYRRPVAMVNYAFRDTEPQTYLSRSFLMAEYGRWMAPAKAGPIQIASCNNISYRRDVLMRYGDDLEQWLRTEYHLHRRIRADGGVIWLEPRAIAAHEDWVEWSDGLRANMAIKRFQAASTVTNGNWSWPRRLFYAAAMPVAPALHVLRLLHSLRNRPNLWWAFVAALPVIVPTYSVMSISEALGYLFGPGSSVDEFNETELRLSRKPL